MKNKKITAVKYEPVEIQGGEEDHDDDDDDDTLAKGNFRRYPDVGRRISRIIICCSLMLMVSLMTLVVIFFVCSPSSLLGGDNGISSWCENNNPQQNDDGDNSLMMDDSSSILFSPAPLYILRGNNYSIVYADEDYTPYVVPPRDPKGLVTYQSFSSSKSPPSSPLEGEGKEEPLSLKVDLRWCVGNPIAWKAHYYSQKDRTIQSFDMNLTILFDQQNNEQDNEQEQQIIRITAVHNGHRWAARWAIREECSMELGLKENDPDMTQTEFEDILKRLDMPSDWDEWQMQIPLPLARRKTKIVLRYERQQIIEQMLLDVPIPTNLPPDIWNKPKLPRFQEYYQLGAFVTSAVGCSWFRIWMEASQIVNSLSTSTQTTVALDALTSSKDWKILDEMKSTGGWTSSFRGYIGELQSEEEPVAPERLEEMKRQWGSGLGCSYNLPDW